MSIFTVTFHIFSHIFRVFDKLVCVEVSLHGLTVKLKLTDWLHDRSWRHSVRLQPYSRTSYDIS